jgi:hypothetical protein
MEEEEEYALKMLKFMWHYKLFGTKISKFASLQMSKN